jgi:NTE family protein
MLLPGMSGGFGQQQRPPKIGLVLSGGGARAAAQIGVLKVLEREHIPIDCIAATSFGALVGGLFSTGYSADEIETILSSQDWRGIFSDAPQRHLGPLVERRNARYQGQISFKGWLPELPPGLLNGQGLREALDELTALPMLQVQYDFDQLPLQFRAVATNLLDGTVFIFKKGRMTEALRASMAIPLVFSPVEKNGALLADGGIADNLPTDIARDLGADIIIAVDASSPLLEKNEIRNFVNVIDQSLSLEMVRRAQENRKLANIVLTPNLSKYSNNDYDMLQEIIAQGEDAAEKHLSEIKALTAGIPYHPHDRNLLQVPIIADLSFEGLKRVKPAQMQALLRVHPGDSVSAWALRAETSKLYATRLFESVEYYLEPLGNNLCRLVFKVEEAPMRVLGAGLRYDSEYDFVALVEFTARQLFNTPSSAVLSTQFGGLENHFAALNLIPAPRFPLAIEPRVDVLRQERLDIRNQELVDQFTDEREGGELMIGGSLFNQLRIDGGYRAERIRISGGTPPNRLPGNAVQAGLTLRLNRDSLNSPDFPEKGAVLRMQLDKRSPSMGGDLNYSRLQADYQRYFAFTGKSTLRIGGVAGYSQGPIPFYDLFYVGGYSFSERASRQFMGLRRDEIQANQMATVGASYRRQILSHPLGLVKRAFLNGSYNGLFYSNRQESPYNFKFLNGAGLGMAFETIFGPVRATVGLGERGRVNFYISLGPSF